jgi:hypothetical protein
MPPRAHSSHNVRLEGGNFQETSLFVLLAAIQMARATGSLVCTRKDTAMVKEIYFSDGRIVGSRSNDDDELIARLLLRWRIIDEKTFQRYDGSSGAAGKVPGPNKAGLKAGEHLIAWGMIDRVTLEQALRQQILLRIGEVFSWEEGAYLFSPGEVRPQMSPLSYADVCAEGVGVRYGSRFLGVNAARLLDQRPEPVRGSTFEMVVFDESELLNLYDRVTGRISFRGLLDPRIPERFWRHMFAMRELGCITFDVPESGAEAASASAAAIPAAPDLFTPSNLRGESDAAFRAGRRYLRGRQFAEAELAFFKAVVLKPDNGDLLAHLAWARVLQSSSDMGSLEANLTLMNQAVRMVPHSADAAFFEGGLLRLLGRNEEALQAFERVLRLAPEHSEARLVVESLRRVT